ncbi:MAG TPA: Os1348 family NHLP clan protein [Candidatus Limnocylindria bacterium]
MSKEALTKVVQRAISDQAFRRQLARDASGALRGYDLTADEINAMRSRDVAKLTGFGVDLRMSKVFVFDQGAAGSASLTGGSEPRDTAPVWIGDGGDSNQNVHTYSGDDNAGPEATDIHITTGDNALDQ